MRHELHRRLYPVRASYMAMGGLVVAASLAYQPARPGWWAFTAITALAWPHLAFAHSRLRRNPIQAEYVNGLIDAAIVGCWLALMQWSLLPCTCILAISLADRFYTRLRQQWRPALFALAGGMLLAALLLQPEPRWGAPLGVQISLLPLIVLHSIHTRRLAHNMLTTVTRQNLQLKRLGRIDPLTTVCSRDYWWQQARDALRNFHLTQEPTCLLVIDIDYFKNINDFYGHVVGDQVLKHIGLTIRQCLRLHDIAGRYGGDEFTVLCRNASAEDAYFVALRIRDRLARIRLCEHPELRISASIGVAPAEPRIQAVTQWIKAADVALYSAKDAGRDQVITAIGGISRPMPLETEFSLLQQMDSLKDATLRV